MEKGVEKEEYALPLCKRRRLSADQKPRALRGRSREGMRKVAFEPES